MSTEPPSSVGPYDVLASLGESGRVVRATHRDSGGDLALRRLGAGAVDAARFATAARAVSRADHPHVARVRDADAADGAPYVVTDYVEGDDLGAWVAEHGPRPLAEAVRLGAEVAGALAALHENGAVHGRLRPASVVRRRTDGAFVLTDFGEALDAVPRGAAPPPPEADQAGLGALLFLALTGRPAPDAGDPPPRPSAFRDDVPGWLDVLVARGLGGHPRGPYEDVERIERALRNAPPLPDAPPAPAMRVAPPAAAAPPSVPAVEGLDRLPQEPPRAVPPPVAAPPAEPPVGRGGAEPEPAPPPAVDPPPVRPSAGPVAPATPPPAPPAPADLGRPSPEPSPAAPVPPAVAALRDRPARAATAGGEVDRSTGRVSRPVLWALLGAAALALLVVAYGAVSGGSDDDGAAGGPETVQEAAPTQPPLAPVAETPATETSEAEPPPGADGPAFSADRARSVADAYLQAGVEGDRAAIESQYADRVQYYDRGSVGRDVVLQDKGAYLRRWPERSYRRVSDVSVEEGAGGAARLRFDYTFRVRGGGRSAGGAGWAEITVLPEGDGFRIVGEDGDVTSRT